jgi:uncharacterized protein YdaU (DUF1376 family)
MAKESRPAMPFYGKDFYGDVNVVLMTIAEQGMYLKMIWYCWSEGSVPDDPERLSRLFQVDRATFEKESFSKLRACFEAADGRLVHRKIERIRAELDEFRNKKKRAGKKGAEKRWRE